MWQICSTSIVWYRLWPGVLSHANILSKWQNRASWFLTQRLPSSYVTLYFKTFGYIQNLEYIPLEPCPRLWTWLVFCFLQRDAMLEQYMLGPCVCLSITSHCSTTVAKWIELIVGMEAFFNCFIRKNSGNSKNKGTFLWNFVPNSERWKFLHGKSIVTRCCQ